MADKTIRYSIDDKGVSQSNEKIRRSFEETQRKILDTQKEGKRLSRDEIQDLEKKIKLQEQLNRQKEEQLKREIEDRNISVQKQKIELDNWVRKRKEQAEGLTGNERTAFMRETSTRSSIRQESISGQKSELLDRRKEYAETRDSNRKQISELRNVTDTIKNESVKGRRETGGLLNRVVGGVSGIATSGSLAGGVGVAGMALGLPMAAIGAVSALLSDQMRHQGNVTQMASVTQLPYKTAKGLSSGLRSSELGMGQKEMMDKFAMYSSSLGSILAPEQLKGYAGVGLARGISDQQISQLLGVQRYTGVSGLSTVSVMENYMSADNKSLIKLPELLDSYLRVANSILQRTGRVDAISLQQTMMSIGKSYGVEGVNLDRMTGNIVGAASNTNNSILKSMQLQTLRRMHPGKSMWELRKIMEDPTSDPEYIKNLMNTITSSFGGGDYAKFAMLGMGLGPTGDIEKMMAGDFNLTSRPTSSGGKDIQDKYLQSGGEMVGTLKQIETSIGHIFDVIRNKPWAVFGGQALFGALFQTSREYQDAVEEATFKGTKRAIDSSGGKFP